MISTASETKKPPLGRPNSSPRSIRHRGPRDPAGAQALPGPRQVSGEFDEDKIHGFFHLEMTRNDVH